MITNPKEKDSLRVIVSVSNNDFVQKQTVFSPLTACLAINY